jgi:hypothetical protein
MYIAASEFIEVCIPFLPFHSYISHNSCLMGVQTYAAFLTRLRTIYAHQPIFVFGPVSLRTADDIGNG